MDGTRVGVLLKNCNEVDGFVGSLPKCGHDRQHPTGQPRSLQGHGAPVHSCMRCHRTSWKTPCTQGQSRIFLAVQCLVAKGDCLVAKISDSCKSATTQLPYVA